MGRVPPPEQHAPPSRLESWPTATVGLLATACFSPEDGAPWNREVRMPAVWTREWGKGRVFVSIVGHKLEDLELPQVRGMTERGLVWTSR